MGTDRRRRRQWWRRRPPSRVMGGLSPPRLAHSGGACALSPTTAAAYCNVYAPRARTVFFHFSLTHLLSQTLTLTLFLLSRSSLLSFSLYHPLSFHRLRSFRLPYHIRIIAACLLLDHPARVSHYRPVPRERVHLFYAFAPPLVHRLVCRRFFIRYYYTSTDPASAPFAPVSSRGTIVDSRTASRRHRYRFFEFLVTSCTAAAVYARFYTRIYYTICRVLHKY